MQSPPATANGIKKEPCVSDNITPVNVVIKIPAKFPAKFIIPVMEATCFGVGAISPTIAKVFAPAKDKLA